MSDQESQQIEYLPTHCADELARHRTPSVNTRVLKRGISPRHREIMRRIAMGERQVDIALDMRMSQVSLSFIVNSPLFQVELRKMMERVDESTYDAMRELRVIQKDAVEAIHESVKQTDLPVLRFHAARDVLNRTGVAMPKEMHITKEQRSYEELLQQVRIKYSCESETKRSPQDDEDGDEED
jgi:hypothetical protein